MTLENRTITLNTTNELPLLGLGLLDMTDPSAVEQTIATALDSGYRLFDTASSYKNEDAVGKAIRQSNVAREELFITTKIWNTAQRMGDVQGAFARSLDRLRLDYVDLYLIQWPVTGCYLDTWKEFYHLFESGRAKAIGVSNFSIQNLEELAQISDIIPAVNQIEYHPLYIQEDLLTYCKEKSITIQACAPLARGAYLQNDKLQEIATKYDKTPSQVGLRWAIQNGISVIPSSSNPNHIISNAQIFDFHLSDIDMATIDELHEDFSVIPAPDDI